MNYLDQEHINRVRESVTDDGTKGAQRESEGHLCI